jgi:hypothetical protein
MGIYYAGTGGGIRNYGTIEGGSYGIFVDDSHITFSNGGVISGHVALADHANVVNLAAGSIINGDFSIGSHPGSELNFNGDPSPSLLYSTVGGNARIGTARVYIDPAELPGDLLPGDVLILIDLSEGTMTGAPANSTLKAYYTYSLSVLEDRLIAEILNVPEPPPVPPAKNFYITAGAGPGAVISPAGTSAAEAGSSKMFRFSADGGYTLSSVEVDGVPLSAEQVASGSYMFFNVRANHTISVSGRTLLSDIPLNIDLDGWKGRAEYSVNGGPFLPYTGTVSLQEFSDVLLRAYADTGYQFDRWEEGGTVYETAEISKYYVGGPVHLKLYFERSDSTGIPMWAASVLLLFAAAGALFLRPRVSLKG